MVEDYAHVHNPEINQLPLWTFKENNAKLKENMFTVSIIKLSIC